MILCEYIQDNIILEITVINNNKMVNKSHGRACGRVIRHDWPNLVKCDNSARYYFHIGTIHESLMGKKSCVHIKGKCYLYIILLFYRFINLLFIKLYNRKINRYINKNLLRNLYPILSLIMKKWRILFEIIMIQIFSVALRKLFFVYFSLK